MSDPSSCSECGSVHNLVTNSSGTIYCEHCAPCEQCQQPWYEQVDNKVILCKTCTATLNQ